MNERNSLAVIHCTSDSVETAVQSKSQLSLTRKRSTSLVLASYAPFLLAACIFGQTEGSRRDESAQVVMELIAFKPEVVEVSRDTTVTWTNKDAAVHSVTSGTVEQGAAGVDEKPDGEFDSGEVAHDRTFSSTFEEVGTYNYFCSFHPATMRGEVRVE